MQQNNVAGLSIALVDHYKLVWAEGFGFQNMEDNISATDRSIYNLASVTKLITATAIMQLVEQGLIDLDQPIREYIPEFQIRSRFTNTQPVTVRTLLTHHSGLPGDREINQLTSKPFEHFSVVLEHYKKEYAAYPPDHVWAYCNQGYNLLGVIIERISDSTYEEYIQRNIFEPLGMKNTAVSKDDIPVELHSKVYRTKSNSSYWYSYFRDRPAGGLLSSVYEMSFFMRMVLNEGSFKDRDIIQRDTLEEMLTVQNDVIPLDIGFKLGLGWYLDRVCLRYAGRYCGHGGDFAAAHTHMSLLPDHKLGVIVAANTDTAAVIVREIADLALQLALEIKTGLKPPDENHESVKLAKNQLHEYKGLYATRYGLYTVKADDKQLKIKVSEDGSPLPWLTLIRNDDGWFSAKFPFSTIPNFKRIKYPFHVIPDIRVFIKKIDNKKYMYIEKTEDQYPIGMAFVKKPVSDIWRKRVGSYKVVNFEPEIDTNIYQNWQIIYEDDILFFRSKTKLVIEPINDHEAIILCLGRNCRETVHFKTRDGQELLEYAGLEYIKAD
jgi:CubicO group peptidase (beta-lactamase class C family)